MPNFSKNLRYIEHFQKKANSPNIILIIKYHDNVEFINNSKFCLTYATPLKFSTYPNAHNIFASLSNSESIEVGKVDNVTMNIEQVKSDRPVCHSRFVNDIHWSPKLPKLASVCRDSNLYIWQIAEDSIKHMAKFNTVSQVR